MILSLGTKRYSRADWLRLGSFFSLFVVALVTMMIPDAAMAGGGFNGQFGPNATLVTNTDTSLLAWWKAIAGWLLWLAVLGFLFSIIFAGGKWWWIPVAVFLVALFGEPAVSQVKSWAGMGSTSSS